jgi:hypothetical protein
MQFIKMMLLYWLHNHGMHFWEYRNPACRTCAWCHKHQDQYVMAYEGTNWMDPRYGWWEDMN